MKRRIAAGLSICAMALGVGWKLASHPETSTGLQEISLVEHSEHSQPGPSKELAGIRIRLSGGEINPTDRAVPNVSVAAR